MEGEERGLGQPVEGVRWKNTRRTNAKDEVAGNECERGEVDRLAESGCGGGRAHVALGRGRERRLVKQRRDDVSAGR